MHECVLWACILSTQAHHSLIADTPSTCRWQLLRRHSHDWLGGLIPCVEDVLHLILPPMLGVCLHLCCSFLHHPGEKHDCMLGREPLIHTSVASEVATPVALPFGSLGPARERAPLVLSRADLHLLHLLHHALSLCGRIYSKRVRQCACLCRRPLAVLRRQLEWVRCRPAPCSRACATWALLLRCVKRMPLIVWLIVSL